MDAPLIASVRKAAEQGAKVVASDRPDLIEETGSEVTLRWHSRVMCGNAPMNPTGWAFFCGRNYARRILKDGGRHIQLSDAIAEGLIDTTEESALIEKIDSAPIHWLRAGDAIEAVNKLIAIATQIIHHKANDLDRRILDLHYKHHWTFSRIAMELGITETSARQRWSRLLFAVADDIRGVVQADQRLSLVFSSILDDTTVFRASIMALLATVSAKGISALEVAIGSLLPS